MGQLGRNAELVTVRYRNGRFEVTPQGSHTYDEFREILKRDDKPIISSCIVDVGHARERRNERPSFFITSRSWSIYGKTEVLAISDWVANCVRGRANFDDNTRVALNALG